MAMAEQEKIGTTRVAAVILAIVLGVSLVGFAVGIRPAAGPAGTPEARAAAAADNEVVASRPYRSLREVGRFGAGERVTSDLTRLRGKIPGLTDKVQRSEEATSAALAARGKTRAYDGAPPTIPHPIDHSSTGAACLSCHATGVQIEGKTAPVMSHQLLASCTQCHVSTAPDLRGGVVAVANSFVGIGSSGPGKRAWPGAPPRVPHDINMRGECSSCHGVTGKPGLRTTHPERGNCTQCHVASGGALPWN